MGKPWLSSLEDRELQELAVAVVNPTPPPMPLKQGTRALELSIMLQLDRSFAVSTQGCFESG